jgi:hypothetical protein
MLERRTREQRHADRDLGVDRFGRPLPRKAGRNPRRTAAHSPAANESPQLARRPVPAVEAAPESSTSRPSLVAPARVIKRSMALKRHCPVCHAHPGELCRSAGRDNPRAGEPRHSCHSARYGG